MSKNETVYSTPTAVTIFLVSMPGVIPDSKILQTVYGNEILSNTLRVDEDNSWLLKLLEKREQLPNAIMTVGTY